MLQTKNSINKENTFQNEALFQNILGEYLHLFGGIRENNSHLTGSALKSFDLAQTHANLSDEEIDCYCLRNFIMNQSLIQESKSETSYNGLTEEAKSTFQFINVLLTQKDGIQEIMHMLTVYDSLKTYLKEFYILSYTKENTYPKHISSKEAKQLSFLTDYMHERKKIINK